MPTRRKPRSDEPARDAAPAEPGKPARAAKLRREPVDYKALRDETHQRFAKTIARLAE